MKLHNLFDRTLREDFNLPTKWNPSNVNPALMTFKEYYAVVNAKNKSHGDEAYSTTLDKMEKKGYLDKSEFPIKLRTVKIKGINFEFRMQRSRVDYAPRQDDGSSLIPDGNGGHVIHTDDEVKAMGLQPEKFHVVVYDEDGRPCGSAQDEWGCVLYYVAEEYQGFGLGTMLGKIAWELEPGKTSGGFSPSGFANFRRTYREFVRDALTQGLYRQEIAAGRMTPARAREIIASADLSKRAKQDTLNLGSKNPSDWMLYADESCFVLYDRKLKDIIAEGGDRSWDWGERMVKGYMLVRVPGDAGIVVRSGADTPKLHSFMLMLAAGYCQREGVPFYVDEFDLKFVDAKHFKVGDVDYTTGHARAEVTLKAEPVDLAPFMAVERRFRQTFDRYDEFKSYILEFADRKFGQSHG
jgi:hypothetical protein